MAECKDCTDKDINNKIEISRIMIKNAMDQLDMEKAMVNRSFDPVGAGEDEIDRSIMDYDESEKMMAFRDNFKDTALLTDIGTYEEWTQLQSCKGSLDASQNTMVKKMLAMLRHGNPMRCWLCDDCAPMHAVT